MIGYSGNEKIAPYDSSLPELFSDKPIVDRVAPNASLVGGPSGGDQRAGTGQCAR